MTVVSSEGLPKYEYVTLLSVGFAEGLNDEELIGLA